MNERERYLILFFLLIISLGLLFLALSRYSFYQEYIKVTGPAKSFETATGDIKKPPEAVTDRNGVTESGYTLIVDINKADVDTLIKLPGVGRETALKIIEYRNKKGNFTDVNDLLKVKGIGPKKLEKLKNYVKIN